MKREFKSRTSLSSRADDLNHTIRQTDAKISQVESKVSQLVSVLTRTS